MKRVYFDQIFTGRYRCKIWNRGGLCFVGWEIVERWHRLGGGEGGISVNVHAKRLCKGDWDDFFFAPSLAVEITVHPSADIVDYS